MCSHFAFVWSWDKVRYIGFLQKGYGGEGTQQVRAVPCGTCSHLLVVLLEQGQLLSETLRLHLQVRVAQGQFAQDLAKSGDVGFHALSDKQLVLMPARGGSEGV